MEILYFFLGIIFFYTKAIYCFAFCISVWFIKPNKFTPFYFLLGIFYCILHDWSIQENGMPAAEILPKAKLEGQVLSITSNKPGKTQFQFQVNELNNRPTQLKVLLSCYDKCPNFEVGEVCRLEAKLKKPSNLGNPGSFDYVNWLKVRHINWVGYIKKNSVVRIHINKSWWNLTQVRENLAKKVSHLMPSERSVGIFNALTVGITSYIDKKDWELFRKTGTTHLMVISGAHIGLISGLSFKLITWLWSRIAQFCLFYPAQKVGSILGFLMGVGYALIAGFAAPAQRAVVVCFFLSLRNFLKISFGRWQVWRYALIAVLLWEPHVVLAPGFYLSFLAVALLFIGSQRFPWKGWKKTIALQLICLFGLMPLTLYWFSYGAINGILANLIAIPLVGLVIVPLCLVNLILMQWIENSILFFPVHYVIELLFHYLKFVDSFSVINLNSGLNDILQVFALMAGLLIIACFPLRSITPAGVFLIIAGFFPGYSKVEKEEVQAITLDVGQGLGVIIRTANHTLVYDTGPKFYRGSDMAVLAIIPSLKRLGIKRLDKVIISHPDLDHRGGLDSLMAEYPVGELIVNDENFYHRGVNCHDYPQWEWDGVLFRFLGIHEIFKKNKNDNSCILQIENKAGKMLLTGDIEKKAEDYLISNYKNNLKSTILFVPHHGSKTSSSSSFIKEVAPSFALISAGVGNRYHFPHQQTLDTLKLHGIAVLNTIDCGMIISHLGNRPGEIQNNCFKSRLKNI